ncbi:aldose 1-epimerase family protein [Curtobacterium sp. Leaf261]|uniref:aldose 1-epimerase family protein n=1 Tax=Curtobacterium sp. Leaf261 TaxID=1736311 RepID=UPI0006FE6884|nr:aldose 1-epimerase family protein [Curtobacterium sp. Leaf261]KQO63036.1 galactose mutarotase [Curtobacterium sp. Leaf261]
MTLSNESVSDDAVRPLSGTYLTIRSGDTVASIATVGATLRALQYGGRDLIVPFDTDTVRPAFRGAVLAPWPNRVVDGRYRFGGVDHELALTEPRRGHALHGLVVWSDFAVITQADDRVVLGVTIPAQIGYPFRVDVLVEYRVDEDGLHTTVTGTNTGPDAAPWGTAPHPYLVGGPGRVDDWTLTLPADSVLEVTEDRLIPTGIAPVSAEFDMRAPTRIGERFIDHAFTDITRASDGLATITLVADDGHGVRMQFGTECPWVQVHTADQPEPSIDRLGLAVEPMTCAPDAFNAGEERGMVVLAPGESAAASWTISGF